jgi:hypothetical protein
VSAYLQCFLTLSGLFAVAACDPNVVIGAKWSLADGASGGQVGAAGSVSGGRVGAGAAGSGGTELLAGSSGDGGEGGMPAGGSPSADEWCATAPWVNEPVKFVGDKGHVILAGSYLLVYVSGAQIHDVDLGYEVTRHYYSPKNGIEAGHHLFSGESPETGATSVWLDEVGLVGTGPGGTIAQVERANRGHPWPFEHAGGELEITLYDDDYHDNSGPGSRFCIRPKPP